VEEFYCSINFFQTFENEFCAVKTMRNISQGRLFSDSPREHGYTNSHGHCRQNIQPEWIVLSSAFQNWNMYLLTLIPKTIVTRLSSWLIGRGKKRQHRLLSPLHLENCVREKKSAAAAPMHACLNDCPCTLAVFRKKATKLQVVGALFI